ncbi:TadE/TadG family type IV pilus assembly protein [Paraburkholderia tagetis]|uniref:Pilus assembly protein n=1 Tax=Paraburkholderia tagetis TaxID=2913261 RepID=A0A9X1RQJ5_9BURK|nr:TadE/TadG family type IV pilus assembly protein [Paraburkholderia tagetis]MCG5073937.1 pilus assembly protein [Paraburkholderia tagetis]
MIARATNVRAILARARRGKRAQRGTAAIEFALAFPLFFAILYGIVMYSMIFLVQQSLTSAAAEGARAALVYQNGANPASALASRAQAACTRALAVVNWLTHAPQCTQAVNTAPAGCAENTAMDCVQITLTYPWSTNPLVPPLPLMGLLAPSSLVGRATVQISPENLL